MIKLDLENAEYFVDYRVEYLNSLPDPYHARLTKSNLVEWNGFSVLDEVTVSYHDRGDYIKRHTIYCFAESNGKLYVLWNNKGAYDLVSAIRPLNDPGYRDDENYGEPYDWNKAKYR